MDKQINYKFIEVIKDCNLKLIKEYLLEKGADIHACDDYALRWSAREGHIEVVKYLVEHGVNIHVYNDDALRFSAHFGHIEVVKYLVEKGANIHAEEDYALRWSAFRGHIEIVKYLVLIFILRNKPIKYNDKIINNYIQFLNKKARIIQRRYLNWLWNP